MSHFYIHVTFDEAFFFDLEVLRIGDAANYLICPEVFYVQNQQIYDDFFDDVIFTEDFSVETLKEITTALISKHQLQKPIFLSSDEIILLPVAKLREIFGSDGHDVATVTRFTNKIAMKNSLLKKSEGYFNNHVPKYLYFDRAQYLANKMDYVNDAITYLGLPIFAKPTNLIGCRGAEVLYSVEELTLWAESHLEFDNYELDEFISGDLYHVDTIIEKGKVLHTMISKYLRPCFDFTQGKMKASIVIPKDDPDFQKIMEFNQRALDALEPDDNCVTHLEFFEDRNKKFYFVEVAMRHAGTLTPIMYEKAFGYNIQEVYYKLQLGLDISVQTDLITYAARCDYPLKRGVIVSKQAPPQIESALSTYWCREVGERVEDAKDLTHRACSMILTHSDYNTLKDDMYSLDNWYPYEIKDK